jgi:hypothetical protein
MDSTLVWAALSAVLDRLQHPTEHSFGNLKRCLYYALFLAVDCRGCVRFALEKGEVDAALVALLQRFCYRQVMYYVMIRSVATAAWGCGGVG